MEHRSRWDTLINVATLVVLALVLFVLFMPGRGPLARVYADWRNSRRARRKIEAMWPQLARTGSWLSTNDTSIGQSQEAEVVIFSDYQCPFCRELDKQLVILANSGRLPALRIRQLPLRIHPAARLAAASAICADRTGQFRVMHRYLMTTEAWQDHMSAVQIAQQAGIQRIDQFTSCIESGLPDSVIGADSTVASELGMAATPTLVFPEGMVSGALPADSVLAVAARFGSAIH